MEKFNIQINDDPSKYNHSLWNMLAEPLANNMLLPVLLFLFLNNGENKINTEEVSRSSEIMRNVMPYFDIKQKEALSRMDSILDVIHALNRYEKEEYKRDEHYKQSYGAVENKPVKILEAVAPKMKGKGKKTVDRVLVVNDRINRIKSRPRDKKITLEDVENMTDILEMIQSDKGNEVRKLLNKVKNMMEILKK